MNCPPSLRLSFLQADPGLRSVAMTSVPALEKGEWIFSYFIIVKDTAPVRVPRKSS